MGDAWSLCAGLSVFAVVVLSVLGTALKNEYEYIPVHGVNRREAGDTCYYAAVVYVFFALVALCKVATKRPNPPQSQVIELPARL
jgi:hypothetical protein